jgi:FkbM family methyltransferase
MTTLDELIGKHGVPVFIKIDVEGFEEAVLQGLSQPVRALSFEFTPSSATSR